MNSSAAEKPALKQSDANQLFQNRRRHPGVSGFDFDSADLSITQGILWGFISHVGLCLVVGRRRDIHPVMYALAAVSMGLLALERVKFS